MQEFFGKKLIIQLTFFAFRGKKPFADGVFGESGAADRGPARERHADSGRAKRDPPRACTGGLLHLPRIAFTPFRYGLAIETRYYFIM